MVAAHSFTYIITYIDDVVTAVASVVLFIGYMEDICICIMGNIRFCF
jgi:hypothetical protein